MMAVFAIGLSSCNGMFDNDSENNSSDCKHRDPSKIVILEGKEATCQETGLTEGKKCTLCNTVFAPQTIISKLECVESDWIIDKEATEFEEGTKHTECTLCGQKMEEAIIPALGHNYIFVFTPSSDIENGSTYECTRCGDRIVPTNITITAANRTLIGYTGAKGENLVIPDIFKFNGTWFSVTTISDNAFSQCHNLISVTLPNSVTVIGTQAFWNCDGITNVTLGNSVTTIGDQAFYNCYKLSNVTIPSSVIAIGESAFAVCDNLTSIIVDDNSTTYQSINGNLYTKDGTVLVAYASGKPDTNFAIPNSVTTIGNWSFLWCTNLTSISIPDSVTTIEKYAFYLCDGLTNITFEGTVEQWNAITFGYYWREDVPATEVVCSNGIVKLN